MAKSFSIEMPPYWQDLCDAGKLVSDGWAFCNSFNSEMATGGIEEGNPPFEAGVSQRDTDYMHIFNWKKAAEVVAGRQGRGHQRHAASSASRPQSKKACFSWRPNPRARTAST